MTAAEPGVLNLARQSAEWRLIGLLFEQPSAAWREQVAELGAEVADERLNRAAAAALEEASEELYHSIFGPGGPASPREASYFDNIQLGYLIAEICAHYEAFSYKPSLGEAPDHVAVEAGFIAFLRLKEAYALAEGDEDHAAVTHEAAEHFLSEHLARMAPVLAEKFIPSDVEYLILASEALAIRSGEMPRPPIALPVLQDLTESQFDCGCEPAEG
ncbi:MAG TPA: molecular chaperone TorD family protein [Paludibaculum sp.]|jgi:nitrate reductase assembly molybdenum cofactor insertion protein NarJ